MPAKAERLTKQQLWFPAGRYFLRTIKRDDASQRWADWLSDPWTVHVLNTSPRAMTKADIVEYIKSFDQRERLLLGMFERGSRAHVGFIRLDIDAPASEALVSAVIGEKEHRNAGATVNTFIPLLKFVFDDLELSRIRAFVLERNQTTIEYLSKLGWTLEPEPDNPVRSHTDGSLLVLRRMTWDRPGFQAWLKSPIGQRIVKRMEAARG
ncbi:GNAT family N-acetyltransferase [Bradyrhizobium daqingense]|uniref:RimJ/RimL family protein N-acetyltransferase n=1 Tax=Bradyrhizobium daqingense TaxID=993502 RepID=A0A562LJF2_9BRAD|nr:GNAT family protein [Bradyrhizobium daqingense]TWI07735.1 RimJ/RimL family protein N-acetyltransferase [Bradyrhizobium daqingense]UFS89944.1 GNAT family N-acetyltransferase [Bradyrhizobium daqingense]